MTQDGRHRHNTGVCKIPDQCKTGLSAEVGHINSPLKGTSGSDSPKEMSEEDEEEEHALVVGNGLVEEEEEKS